MGDFRDATFSESSSNATSTLLDVGADAEPGRPSEPPDARAVPRRALHGQSATQSQPPPPLPPAHFGEAPNLLRVAVADKVHTNRNLALSSIEWIGFDMDYTLAIYHQDAMDALSVELTVENLIAQGYPAYLRDNSYDFRFPIRGLLIDRELGHVLKMDRFNAIHKGYHGYRRLEREELKRLYWDKKLRPDSERFHWIDTLFGLSEVTAFVSILESMEAKGEHVDYGQLFTDIRNAIDLAHATGEVHRRVLSDLPRYVDRDSNLAATLHKLRSSGKKLFVLTNSPWDYTDGLLTYLLGSSLPEYRNWQQFFNVVIVSAKKPHWFQYETHFVDRDRPEGVPLKLDRGRVYEGGNLHEFERLTGVRGSSVLYIGDHIYGDILRSKKHSGWRTAMIIQELDTEVAALHRCQRAIRDKLELDERREQHEDELRYHQACYKQLARKGTTPAPSQRAEREQLKSRMETLRGELKDLHLKTEALERAIDEAFHPYWGSLLKEHGELSSFGAQVGRYGDVYMRRVSSLRHYSPHQMFRSPHDFMPHEV